jgi:hypothetical protein
VTFALIDVRGLEVVYKLDRSVVIDTIQSGNDCVLDLVPTESASLADDTNNEFRHPAFGQPEIANVNQKFYEGIYT